MIYQDIQKDLFKKQDVKYKEFMLKSIPNEIHLIGVRMSLLRKMADQLVRCGVWEKYLSYMPFYHEEKIIQAFIIANRMHSFDDVNLIKNFIPQITNWAVCDCFCTHLKQVKNYLPEFFDFLKPYFLSEKEFEVRFAFVLILNHFVVDAYLSDIFNLLDSFNHSGYYAKMAAAWLLSVCYVKYPDQTYLYLKTSKLDNETYNKGIQKIIESNQVDDLTRKQLRFLKRN